MPDQTSNSEPGGRVSHSVLSRLAAAVGVLIFIGAAWGIWIVRPSPSADPVAVLFVRIACTAFCSWGVLLCSAHILNKDG